jgi:hypothetical protein
MTIISKKAPKAEQRICVTCGMCCDGTLFLHASLNPGEKGNLPEKIEQQTFTEGEKDYFRLPCRYFSGKCSIYKEERAYVCGSYRCQLLKDFSEKKVNVGEALKIIRQAKALREEIYAEFCYLSGKNEVIYFKQLFQELIKIIDSGVIDKLSKPKFELVLGKCNVLEALLIKHLRSISDFENIMLSLPQEDAESKKKK